MFDSIKNSWHAFCANVRLCRRNKLLSHTLLVRVSIQFRISRTEYAVIQILWLVCDLRTTMPSLLANIYKCVRVIFNW